jgi:hypothetical protein
MRKFDFRSKEALPTLEFGTADGQKIQGIHRAPGGGKISPKDGKKSGKCKKRSLKI